MGFLDALKKMFAGNPRHYHDQLGLRPDEDFRSIVGCTLWQDPSGADNAEAIALGVVGIFTGHTVVQTGVQAMAGITTTQRLVIGLNDGRQSAPMSFAAGSGLRLLNTGRTSPEALMGPTGGLEPGHILSLAGPKGELFQLIVAASKASELAGWS